jgi:hypothetical protein
MYVVLYTWHYSICRKLNNKLLQIKKGRLWQFLIGKHMMGPGSGSHHMHECWTTSSSKSLVGDVGDWFPPMASHACYLPFGWPLLPLRCFNLSHRQRGPNWIDRKDRITWIFLLLLFHGCMRVKKLTKSLVVACPIPFPSYV